MTSNVFMITCAYEQGVGKGHQAFNRESEVSNPYIDSVCNEAWALGYKEGKAQAKKLKQVGPVAVVRQEFGRGVQAMTNAQIKAAKANWFWLRAAIRTRVWMNTPSRVRRLEAYPFLREDYI